MVIAVVGFGVILYILSSLFLTLLFYFFLAPLNGVQVKRCKWVLQKRQGLEGIFL